MREKDALKLPSRLYLEILQHAQEEWPLEACGILGGRERKIMRVFKAYNEDQSEVSFNINPKEQIRILEEIEREGLSLIGTYHSHPKTDPFPSKKDRELSFYPEIFSVIISLKRREKPQIRAFLIEKERLIEVPIDLIDD